MNKILVADVPPMDARYTAALRGWEIEFVRTLGAARQALGAARYDLVAIGVYFDDSQMFDLVRALRAAARTAGLPILRSSVLASKRRSSSHRSRTTAGAAPAISVG